MKTAIIQEWLARDGGSEKVTEQLAAAFPAAPIYCLWDDAPDRFGAGRVHESWLAKTPLRTHKRFALPFMPVTWRHLGTSDAERIICSSHLFAHHARFSGAGRDATKYVYVHTPARYIWNPELDERGDSLAARTVSRVLKPMDRRRAQEAVSIVANSRFVSDRIRDAWGIETAVINPPVDTAAFDPTKPPDLTAEEESILEGLPGDYLLGASRHIPYKRLDTVIRLGSETGTPTVISGDGPETARLKELAESLGSDTRFVGRPSTELLAVLYRNAGAYVFPAVEDFGMMPVEAMASGTPVIALNRGGAAESVVDGSTGVLIESFDSEYATDAVHRALLMGSSDCVARAKEFGLEPFQKRIHEWVGDA
ncbi:MAG: glycosyltransferase [Solirubrobacterales bacterium]